MIPMRRLFTIAALAFAALFAAVAPAAAQGQAPAPQSVVLDKAIPADPSNPGSFVIPAGSVCQVSKREAGSNRIVVNCPVGYSELGRVDGVNGLIDASDVREVPACTAGQ